MNRCSSRQGMDRVVTAIYLEPDQEVKAHADGGGERYWTERLFSTLYACPNCGISFEELEPRTFSFNSPLRRLSDLRRDGQAAWNLTRSLSCPMPLFRIPGGAIAPWKGVKSATGQEKDGRRSRNLSNRKNGDSMRLLSDLTEHPAG